jgi:glycosyltransferase involved in cell wall biosynthesis
MYFEALQRASVRQPRSRPALVQALLATPGLLGGDQAADDAMLQQLARCMAHAPDPLQPRQLLVDVTTIARHDLKTGIERVVRNQLLELLQLRASGWRVEPVYLSKEDGRQRYRYARNYVARLLGIDATLTGPDPLLDVQAGDVYYSADHAPHAVMEAARDGVYAELRARGVTLNFLVHDLLPVLRPEFFPAGADAVHGAWLQCAAGMADRMICISAAVADELQAWLEAQDAPRIPPLAVLHHGADLEAGAQAQASAPAEANLPLLRQLAGTPVFLMVGTIEPRKGHLQALDAFEQLWRDGVAAHLVIVGNEGWKGLAAAERRTIPTIVARLQRHPQQGQQLHWLQGLDDHALQQLYRNSTCLLQPSEGEGFGLPLIEAARYDLPVLARGLPVFREVAGEHAYYFDGMAGADLAGAITAWLALHANGQAPVSSGMPWLTWEAQVQQLLNVLAGRSNGRI